VRLLPTVNLPRALSASGAGCRTDCHAPSRQT